jgi:hypothetical protein
MKYLGFRNLFYVSGNQFEFKPLYPMQKLQFQKEVAAPAQKVYDTMLGLTDKATYEYWTAAFNPTSTYEGDWSKGSKILFTGVDGNGKKGGMVSEVVEWFKFELIATNVEQISEAKVFHVPSA